MKKYEDKKFMIVYFIVAYFFSYCSVLNHVWRLVKLCWTYNNYAYATY